MKCPKKNISPLHTAQTNLNADNLTPRAFFVLFTLSLELQEKETNAMQM